jgi:hypothetical protein
VISAREDVTTETRRHGEDEEEKRGRFTADERGCTQIRQKRKIPLAFLSACIRVYLR